MKGRFNLNPRNGRRETACSTSTMEKRYQEDPCHPEYKHNMPLRGTGAAAGIILMILFLWALIQA